MSIVNSDLPALRFEDFVGDLINTSIADVTIEHKQGFYSNDRYVSDGVYLIRGSDLMSPKISFENMPKLRITDKDYEAFKVIEGDFLFARSGGIGRYGIVHVGFPKAIFGSYLIRFRFDSKIMLSSYFGYYFTTEYCKNQLRKITQSSANVNINAENIKKLVIPLPTISEQKKVIDFLTLIDQFIDNFEKKIKLLELQKKGIMQMIFSQELRFKKDDGDYYRSWENVKLGDLSCVTNGKGDVQDALSEGKYPFFDRSNVIKYVDEYLFEGEAIIYPGEGSEFIPKYYSGKYGLHQRCYTINTFDILHTYPKYIYYYLLTQNNYFLRSAVGSTVKSLRMDNFSDINIKLPEIKEQLVIIGFLSKLDMRIENCFSELNNYKSLKSGLMQRMFV